MSLARLMFTAAVAAALTLAGCARTAPGALEAGAQAVAGSIPVSTMAGQLAAAPGIINPSNLGWPREGQGLNGKVTVKAKPQRIHTLSLGHDEVTYALVPPARVAAVGKYTQDPIYSNVAELARLAPGIGREPEQIVAQQPDLVVASHTIKADLIKALENAGLEVVQTQLHNDPQGRIQDILFLGYLYGEEGRAVELAAEVSRRSDSLAAFVRGKAQGDRPRVLALTSYSDKIYAAGKGSTEGTIVELAGGLNAAAEAGMDGNKTIGAEGLISMRPEVIIIAQPADSGEPFRKKLLADPALAEVPAIKQQRLYLVEARYFTTLSFWNIRGAEELARILWPADYRGKEFGPFSFPG